MNRNFISQSDTGNNLDSISVISNTTSSDDGTQNTGDLDAISNLTGDLESDFNLEPPLISVDPIINNSAETWYNGMKPPCIKKRRFESKPQINLTMID